MGESFEFSEAVWIWKDSKKKRLTGFEQMSAREWQALWMSYDLELEAL